MMKNEPAVRAVEFETRKVYQSEERPSYTSWVSFFPGERGQWYLTCEEVKRPKKPLPQCTREQWYRMCLPVEYDKSQYLMEMVILESTDNMKTWKVISREPCRFHHSAGSFAQARTKDGRFLRFVWTNYSLSADMHPGKILYVSEDDGKTWRIAPPFHDRRFFSYPHRLRTLHDGTMVLAIPFAPGWGPGYEYPIRCAQNLDVDTTYQMMLYFSNDQGRNWIGPVTIYGGKTVSETDFVELPSGDLLCINNFSASPGRQIVYRTAQGWVPGPFERVRFVEPGEFVPETICLTEDGILVGCIRARGYMWSDDMGQTWWHLEGTPHLSTNPEMYQPWIYYLSDGRIACAGHYGGDDPFGSRDQYIMIHFFRLEVLRKTKNTHIDVVRDFDKEKNRWLNSYTISLTCDGEPLTDKELEFWYVERYQPGYDDYRPLEERMKIGGKMLKVRTGRDGRAHVTIPHLDEVTDIHLSYQFVVRFNIDRSEPEYKPTQSPQFEFYALSYMKGR